MAKINKEQGEQAPFVKGRALADFSVNGMAIKCGWPVEIPSVLADVFISGGYIDINQDAILYALSEHGMVEIDV
jgi:hypothetical protein